MARSVSNRSALTGRFVSQATSARRSGGSSTLQQVAGGTSRTRTVTSSSETGRFVSGTKVRVRFGAKDQPAVVLEQRGDRVRVGINVEGVDDQIISTYLASEVHQA